MPKQKITNNKGIAALATEILQNLQNGNTISLVEDEESNIQTEEELLNGLKEIDGLDTEIENILALLQTTDGDLSKLQTMLILLLNKYLSTKKSEQSLETQQKIKKIIEKEVTKASQLIIEQYRNFLREHKHEIDEDKNLFLQSSNFAKQQLKKLIKAFAVYEIYKVMSPRRIAGETKLDNFVHNVLSHHDVKYATKFTGGNASDIKSYSPSVKNTLKKQNIKNKDLLGR